MMKAMKSVFSFRPMSEVNYNKLYEALIQQYTQAMQSANEIPKDADPRTFVSEQVKQSIPDGMATKNHEFYDVFKTVKGPSTYPEEKLVCHIWSEFPGNHSPIPAEFIKDDKHSKDMTWIHYLLVPEEERGKGLGKDVLREYLNFEAQRDRLFVALSAYPHERDFYSKAGFIVSEQGDGWEKFIKPTPKFEELFNKNFEAKV